MHRRKRKQMKKNIFSIVWNRGDMKFTGSKFLGVYIPLELDLYITLYGLANNISKSIIIRSAIQIWKKNQSITTHGLLDRIRSKIQNEWIHRKLIKPNSNQITDKIFKEFKEEIQMILSKKGVPEKQIQMILNQLVK